MRNYIGSISVAAGLLASSAATSGPLTDVLLSSLEGKASISWAEGYQEGTTENLEDVVVKMNDGRRLDISALKMDSDGTTIDMTADNLRINPEGDILLLRADTVKFQGGRAQLSALWDFDLITDSCPLIGPQGKLEVGGFGMIVAAAPGTRDDNSTYRASRFELRQKSSGTTSACVTDIGFTVQDYQAVGGDGSSTVSSFLDLEVVLPGSLASLAAAPQQKVSLKIEGTETANLINGGATAWAIDAGKLEAEFSALGLVPAMTLSLKHREAEKNSGFWMQLWNTLDDAMGRVEFDIDSMTMRSANILPPVSVAKFSEGGLTTVILSGVGDVEMSRGDVKAQGEISATGLMSASLAANLRLSQFPPGAIAKHIRSPDILNLVPPIYVDQLRYEQTDDGMIDAAASIMGMPLTVLINQVREEQGAKNPSVESVIRDVATAVANFVSISYRNPPARVDMAIDPDLDLREAVIVSRSLPGEILNIFDFTVDTGAK